MSKPRHSFLRRGGDVSLWQNGPVEYRGDLRIAGDEPSKRAVLCRCGHSKNRPFCDGAHKDCGFESAERAPDAAS